MKYYSESGLEIKYGTEGAAGLDIPFYDPEMESVTIQPGERVALKTGIYCEFPEGYYGHMDSRSSTSKLKIDLLCHTIDGDYIGNIRLPFINNGSEPVTVNRGDYLTQMIITPYRTVYPEMVSSPDQLKPSNRGDRGFGHTGGSQVANGEAE